MAAFENPYVASGLIQGCGFKHESGHHPRNPASTTPETRIQRSLNPAIGSLTCAGAPAHGHVGGTPLMTSPISPFTLGTIEGVAKAVAELYSGTELTRL